MRLNPSERTLAGTVLTMLLLAPGSLKPQTPTSEPTDQILKNVASIHGAAGVFAVAGYRMGERALKELDLPRGSFAIEVVHHTPFEVQWSCVADGLQAATGASAGKLNLRLVEAPKDQVETVVTNRKTGQRLVFHLQPEFVDRFLNLPYDRQPAAGRDVAEMPETEIFSTVLHSGAAKPESTND